MDLKEEHLIDTDINEHWYYKCKAAALLHYIESLDFSKILDVGAGSGFFSKYLLKHTDASSSECVDIGYDHDYEKRIGEKSIRYLRDFSGDPADLILFMDVVEHVENDLEFIQSIVEESGSHANVLFTVPAFTFMWSQHDVFLGHKRRYTLKGLKAVVENSGLEIVKINYYFAAIFPIAFVVRLINKLRKSEQKSDLKNYGKLANFLLSFVCQLEMNVMDLNKFFGLTIFCLCKKKPVVES